MKKHLLAIIMIVSCQATLVQALPLTEKLMKAIEISDLNSVVKLIKRSGPFDSHTQKELLNAAEDIVDERETRVSIFRSGWDMTKLLGGTAVGLVGVYASFRGLKKILARQSPRKQLIGASLTAVGGVATCFGFYKALHGLLCQTAKARLATAIKIRDLLKKVEVKDSKKRATS